MTDELILAIAQARWPGVSQKTRIIMTECQAVIFPIVSMAGIERRTLTPDHPAGPYLLGYFEDGDALVVRQPSGLGDVRKRMRGMHDVFRQAQAVSFCVN